MKSILRAQERDQKWPFEALSSVDEYDIALPIAPPPMPMSPHHRGLRRSRSELCNDHNIDIIPSFENPCRPCRSSPRPRSSKNSSSCFSKFRSISPYLSVACFIAILVWEISSLHAEVYKLRVNDNHRISSANTNSGSYLRRISSERSKKDYNPTYDEITTTQLTTSTPIPPSLTRTGSLDSANDIVTKDDDIIYKERGDIEKVAEEYESIGQNNGGSQERKIIGTNIDNEVIREDKNSLPSPPSKRTSAVEDQLAELLATRELLKSSRRRPSTNSPPLSQMENPYHNPIS